MSRILVTGSAGFIGFHLAQTLLKAGHAVFGIDNMNNYYDINLKNTRLEKLMEHETFRFTKVGLEDKKAIESVFSTFQPEFVVNLAAQAGVRYSLQNPMAYIDSNLTGFANILECCRHYPVSHLVFASSSSVYGSNTRTPFRTTDNVDHPLSLYAATKKSNELMAHSYANLYNIPCTGLRFFTVYGPWGRPDMAVYSFTKAIIEGQPISIYNHGHLQRDFTYIEDIVDGINRVLIKPPVANPDWDRENSDPSASFAPYKIYNIGNNQPAPLMEMVALLEKVIGKEARKTFLPMQAGDVFATYADIDDLTRDVGFKPRTSLAEGLQKFVDWYREYHSDPEITAL